MTKTTLLIAAVLTFQSFSPAFASTPAEQRQAQLLQIVESKGASSALAALSNDELLQAKEDLRAMIAGLSVDLSNAQQEQNGMLKYQIRKYALIGSGLDVLLLAAGIYAATGPERGAGDLPTVAALGLGAAAIVTVTASEVVILLTPNEVTQVQAKINKLVELLQKLDARLKK